MFCDQLTDLLSALWHKEVIKSILKGENMQLSEFVVTLLPVKPIKTISPWLPSWG